MTGPGIHTMSAEEYHADPCERPSLSASIINVMCQQSPLHAHHQHPRLNPQYVREHSDTFDLGTIAHAVFLEGSDNVVHIVQADDWRTNAAKDDREQARAAGKVPILRGQWDRVQELVGAIAARADAFQDLSPLFTDGKAEQTLIWDEDGVLCRARLDWLRNDHRVIDDLKTTAKSANPDVWSRTLYTIGADVQVAFYLRGLYKVTGKAGSFRFVVVETHPPYAMSVVSVSPAGLTLAERKVKWAIDTWRACLETGEWPSYPTKVCWAEPSPWAEAQWLDHEEVAA